MKVMLCSVPKSGTYLLSNFLIELNFNNSHFHFGDEEYSDYSTSTLKTARENPEIFKNICSFDKAVIKIKENEFAVGHFSLDKNQYLSDFKTIFLYRNLKYCTVSFGFWTKNSNRWKHNEKSEQWRNTNDNQDFIADFLKIHGNPVYDLFKKTVPWINEEGILKVNFEKLTGELGREIQIKEFKKIVEYLELNLSHKELVTKISNALNKDSLTKSSSKKDYDFYFSKNFKNYYKKSGLKQLNKILGYENFKDNLISKIKFNNNLSFYDKYWKLNKNKNNSWNYGINIVDNLISNYNFKTVLDAGCGSGDVVKYLISKGYEAKGIELSNSVLKDYANDLYKKRIVQQGSLTKLPFKDNEFDVVFSSEVLEHINEEDIPLVVSELFRVCKKVIFLTISLRPSSNFNKYHINLKPRLWWENQFLKHGLVKDDEVVKNLQLTKLNATVKDIMEIGPTKNHIHEMEWFINKPPYDLNGELEPWYFIFKKVFIA